MYKVIKNNQQVKSGLNRRQAVMYVSALVEGKAFNVIGSRSDMTVKTKCGLIFKILKEARSRLISKTR